MTKVVEELGIPSFKTFMAYKDVFMIDDAEMLECYRHCANIGAIGKLKNFDDKWKYQAYFHSYYTKITDNASHIHKRFYWL